MADQDRGGGVLTRPHRLAQTPAEGVDVHIVANAEERAALARLNGLAAVDRLEARLRVERSGAGGLLVRGALDAELRQNCVVTLEPFAARIEQDIRLRFTPEQPAAKPAERRRAQGERGHGERAHEDEEEPDLLLDLDGDDPPDVFDGDKVDLGAVVVEFFTLALDPYPKKPGAEFVPPAEAGGGEVSPFAALRVLSAKKGE
jgi:hypothetical protein